MARKPRIEYEGAAYHVIVRGNQQQTVFAHRADYGKYLSLLAQYKEQAGFRLFGYVLMRNHVHLVIQTMKVPLSKIMQGINQSYTMYFNSRYDKVGHLFQSRYKAILCDTDSYLAPLVRYVHLNPVRAGAVKKPEDYRWSGHVTLAKGAGDSILDEDTVLRMFSEHKGAARRLYRRYVESGIGEGSSSEYYGGKDSRVLGDDKFKDSVMKRVDAETEVFGPQTWISLPALGRIVEEQMKVPLRDIRGRSGSRAVSRSRHVFMVAAVEAGHRGKDVADYLGRDPAAVSRILKDADRVRKSVRSVLKQARGR